VGILVDAPIGYFFDVNKIFGNCELIFWGGSNFYFFILLAQ
jgi:hypothetical protein